MTLLIIATVLFLLVPAVASLFICVPKWWEQSVQPRLPKVAETSRFKIDWHKNRWYLVWVRWAYMLPLTLFMMTIGLPIIWYISSTINFIERKCPYTAFPPSVHPTLAFSDFSEVFHEMWDFTRGRK